MSVRDFDASSSSYNSTTRHDYSMTMLGNVISPKACDSHLPNQVAFLGDDFILFFSLLQFPFELVPFCHGIKIQMHG